MSESKFSGGWSSAAEHISFDGLVFGMGPALASGR